MNPGSGVIFAIARLDEGRLLRPVAALNEPLPECLLGALPRGCVYVASRSSEVWERVFPEALGGPSASAADGAQIEEIARRGRFVRAAWRVFWPRPVDARRLAAENFTEADNKSK